MPYKVFIDGVLLPVPPSKITTKINNKNETIDLINEGEVNIIKSPGLTEIEFEALLPNVKYPFAMYQKGFKNAIYFLNKLEKLKKNKSTFQFIVTRRNPKGKQLFDTNITVTLEDYEIQEDADENGIDVVVSIRLKQYKPFKIKTVTIKKSSKSKKKTTKKKTSRTAKKSSTKTYTVKKGDTLWAIAKKHLGNPLRYKEIYKLNKDVIEKTAKKYGRKSSNNGHWIYPGTKLKLPAS